MGQDAFKKKCLKHGIILITLPPNLTGAIQFLDLCQQKICKQQLRGLELSWRIDPSHKSEHTTKGGTKKAPTPPRHVVHWTEILKQSNHPNHIKTFQTVWANTGYGAPVDGSRDDEFLSHLTGSKVGELKLSSKQLPLCCEGFNPFTSTPDECLNYKRRGGHNSIKTHAGVRGKSGYRKEDVVWLRETPDFTPKEDPRKTTLDEVDYYASALAKHVEDKFSLQNRDFKQKPPTLKEIQNIGGYVQNLKRWNVTEKKQSVFEAPQDSPLDFSSDKVALKKNYKVNVPVAKLISKSAVAKRKRDFCVPPSEITPMFGDAPIEKPKKRHKMAHPPTMRASMHASSGTKTRRKLNGQRKKKKKPRKIKKNSAKKKVRQRMRKVVHSKRRKPKRRNQ